MRLLQTRQSLHFRRSALQSPAVAPADRTARERFAGADSLEAYPNLSVAAEMLGVAASTISRRPDLEAEGRGERDRVLAPAEVLRLARIFRKRSINQVAQALLDHAEEFGTDAKAQAERQIEEHFEAYSVEAQINELRALARKMLPPELAEQVEKSLERPAGEMPTLVEGYLPLAED